MALTIPRTEAIETLRTHLETGRAIRSRIPGWSSREEFDAATKVWIAEWERWQKFTATLLSRLFGGGPPSGEFDHRQFPRLPGYLNRLEGVEHARAAMDARLNELESILERAEAGFFDRRESERALETEGIEGTDVFIVHGHDREARAEIARFVDRIGLRAIILDEQPDAGLTIIEKFERDAAKVAAAVVLMTPDDVGGPKDTGAVNPRARQNVIFELGYFAAHLGRGRVCALMRGSVEIPSDYKGVIYVPFDEHGGWMLRVARNLQAAGLTVDIAKLL